MYESNLKEAIQGSKSSFNNNNNNNSMTCFSILHLHTVHGLQDAWPLWRGPGGRTGNPGKKTCPWRRRNMVFFSSKKVTRFFLASFSFAKVLKAVWGYVFRGVLFCRASQELFLKFFSAPAHLRGPRDTSADTTCATSASRVREARNIFFC